MKSKENNFAFIDSQNVNLSVQSLGWRLDFAKFKIYLEEKYGVKTAYIFIGYVEGNTDLYVALQKMGYLCVFKPTLIHQDGTTKGNCDAELVLQAMIDYDSYNKAVIVTGDGDFHCLVKYLLGNDKLKAVIIPNRFKYSALLKIREFRPYLRFINDLANKLRREKKNPHRDETL